MPDPDTSGLSPWNTQVVGSFRAFLAMNSRLKRVLEEVSAAKLALELGLHGDAVEHLVAAIAAGEPTADVPTGLEPRYAHDCAACEYLGAYGPYDLYRCPQHGHPTIICRYGSAGDAYTSGAIVEVEDVSISVKRWRAHDFPDDVARSRHFGRVLSRVEGEMIDDERGRSAIAAQVRALEDREPTPGRDDAHG